MSVRLGIPFQYVDPPQIAKAGMTLAQKKRHQPLASRDYRRADWAPARADLCTLYAEPGTPVPVAAGSL